MLQSFFDLSVSTPLSVEASAEATASPAAKALAEKKAGGKTGEAAGRFAKSLGEAQEAKEQGKPARSDRAAAADKEGQAGSRPEKNAALRKKIEELLGSLDGREVGRLLACLVPKESLRPAELLDFTASVLQTLLPSDKASAAAPADGKRGEDRSRLLALLQRLARIAGAEAVFESFASGTVKKPAPTVAAREADSSQIARSVKSAGAGEEGKKPRIVVLDLRKDPPASKAFQEDLPLDKSAAIRSPERAGAADGLERDFSVLLRTGPAERSPLAAASGSVERTPQSNVVFHQRFIPEVVKQTGIILKEGGAGEIRLVLKPENLGSVRIRLSMSESSLEGRIVVDNNSVKELVESSLDNLKNALRLEGYQTANLEVFVGHRRSWDGNNEQADRPFADSWSGWSGGSEEFEKAIPLFLDINPDYEMVNIFA